MSVLRLRSWASSKTTTEYRLRSGSSRHSRSSVPSVHHCQHTQSKPLPTSDPPTAAIASVGGSLKRTCKVQKAGLCRRALFETDRIANLHAHLYALFLCHAACHADGCLHAGPPSATVSKKKLRRGTTAASGRITEDVQKGCSRNMRYGPGFSPLAGVA
jgi:hypothetical protein